MTDLGPENGDGGTSGTAGAERGTFRVAVAPGVVVQRWVGRWLERRPGTPIQVVPTSEDAGVAVLHAAAADVSFVRLPVDREGLSVIPLYEEVPVVVVPHDHLFTAVEEIGVDDLAGEVLLQDRALRPAWTQALRVLPAEVDVTTGRATTALADVLALVAAGAGVMVVPQSVARMHHRKDLTYRPVTDLASTAVGLAWVADRTTADVEEFVGIVRGRTERSSRSPAAGGSAAAPGVSAGTASDSSSRREPGAGAARRRAGSGRPGPGRRGRGSGRRG